MRSDPILITGATGGLGRQLTWSLARRGMPVIIGGRRAAAVANLVEEVSAETGVPTSGFVADLADLDAVQRAIDAMPDGRLGGIVTNAGLTLRDHAVSAQGYELTFAVNVLAHQLLLCRLAGRVVDGGRIVILSSGTHDPDNRLARFFGIPVPRWVGTRGLALPETLEPEERLPPGPIRYSTSKLGNVLQGRGLQERLRAAGRDIDVFAVDPGLMVDTDLAREAPAPLRALFQWIGRRATPYVDNMRLSTTTAGMLTSVLLDPAWKGRGFRYLDGDQEHPLTADAQRDELVRDLWSASLPLVGLQPEELRWTA